MRETCARTLAAALMTAAIATVVGMSALLGPAHEAGGSIAAPPSSLQRTVRLTAHVEPPRRHSRPSTARLVTRGTNRARLQAAPVARLVTVHRHRVRRRAPARQLAATSTTATTTTPVDSVPASAPPPAAVTEPDRSGPGNGHGRGHAYGRYKQDD